MSVAHATPASTQKLHPTANDGGGLHSSYTVSDIHLRRLRKAKCPPPADAAGLIAGSRYSGRGTPLKGKVPAPSHDNVATWDSSPSSVRSAGARPHTSPGVRPLSKVLEQSYKSSMQGSGMVIDKEESKKANSKKLGMFAPKVNTERVFGGRQQVAADGQAKAEDSIWPVSKCRSWAVQLAEAQAKSAAEEAVLQARGQPERSMTLARKQYHEASLGNQDVLRYRHSEGICPAEYKFQEVRKVTAALQVKQPGTAKDVFFDTRSSYSSNRVKGMMSTIVY